MNTANTKQRNNKFFWSDYEAPWPWEKEEAQADEGQNHLSFTMRHLKQGATGAVKTWPAAEALLEYLVRRGGLLRDATTSERHDGDALNLISRPQLQEKDDDLQQPTTTSTTSCDYNILELGAGSGYLGVGLSLSLNREACLRYSAAISGGRTAAAGQRKPVFQPRVRILCTDHDKATIKNMRHNITEQPSYWNITKTVRVEPLDWGDDHIGGNKFSKAIESLFRTASNSGNKQSDDPIRLLTHLVASDVHYGETTLQPLSSIIAAVKLRNPQIVVILLNKERSPDAVADLKAQIEEKVEKGLAKLLANRRQQPLSEHEEQMPSINSVERLLQGFSVSVRDVLHKDITNLKMVEC